MINGFLAAVIFGVSIAVAFGLWKVRQGWQIFQGIQETHNQLVESVSKIDAKAQEALLRLDQINNVLPKKGLF